MRNPLKYLDTLQDIRPIDKLSFLDLLQLIVSKAKDAGDITLKQVFVILSRKGYAAILILCSIPFCLPIQIPGFSTPFGILLVFIGLRISFAQHLWWPDWILQKRIPYDLIANVVQKSTKPIERLQKLLHPRLLVLTQHPICHRLHGLIICLMALILALPIPVPFTNMLPALTIFFIGLGLLENDGYAIIIGYFLAIACVSIFFFLFFFGTKHLASYF